jgi:hypothetical protein
MQENHTCCYIQANDAAHLVGLKIFSPYSLESYISFHPPYAVSQGEPYRCHCEESAEADDVAISENEEEIASLRSQ